MRLKPHQPGSLLLIAITLIAFSPYYHPHGFQYPTKNHRKRTPTTCTSSSSSSSSPTATSSRVYQANALIDTNDEDNDNTMAPSAINVAIIGSGAAGLATARALVRKGRRVSSVTVLEKDMDIGGVWRYTKNDETRPMYRGLRTNLPREIMAFRGKPWGGNRMGRSYVTHEEVNTYLKNYAEEFDLCKYISFGCKVTQLTINDELKPNEQQQQPSSSSFSSHPKITLQWQQQSSSSSSSTDETPSFHSQTFDAVCICNGHYAAPSIPPLPGLASHFRGTVMHSIAYDDPSIYSRKRVLCVGGRASGADLAREISFHATDVYLSDTTADMGGDDDEGRRRRGNVTWVSRTMGVNDEGGVYFEKDDLVLEDVDVIIFCSGYDYQFPFINEKSNLELSVVPGERRVAPLYEQLWHARHPNVAFIGLPHSVVPFPFFELQAEAVAAHLTDTAPEPLPSLDERLSLAEKDAEGGGPKDPGRVQDTHYLGDHQWDYCLKMAKLAGVYDETLEKYVLTNKAIYDHAGEERKAIFPGGADVYRYTCYVRDDEEQTFESFTCLEKV